MRHVTALSRKLQQVFREETADHWVGLLDDAGLPVGHVLTLTEALNDPQARHNQMTVRYEHPTAGPVTLTGSPMRVDGSPVRAAAPPPALGQHTRQLLQELGLDPGTIEQMVEAGTAVAP
jgi:formyl-CoA transferase